MSWVSTKDPDEIVYTFLRTRYEAYRLALPDPTVMPTELQILWDSYYGSIHDTSFIVTEDRTDPSYDVLGTNIVTNESIVTVEVQAKYVQQGKPPWLKHIRNFIEKTLLESQTHIDIKNEGISWMRPGTNSITQMTPPQSDMWHLIFSVMLRYLKHL